MLSELQRFKHSQSVLLPFGAGTSNMTKQITRSMRERRSIGKNPISLTMLSGCVAAAVLFAPLALSQGGPPFRSDDPDTPGNHHWEVNLGFLGDRSPFGGSYETPNIDINYGLGSRIQLKYEVPLSIQETRGDSVHVAGGLGNSLLGVKYRFYQRHSKTRIRDGEREIKFSVSTYPQVLLNNPTRSVDREIVEPGPQLLLPLEANANYGWIRISGEIGYWITSKDVPNSWLEGIVAGHEFRKDTELYVEVYDQRDVRVPAGAPKLSETTFGLGGRLPIVRNHWLRFIGMGGRSFVTPTASNGQPSWIAYVGIQFLSDRRRRHGDE